MNSSIGSYGNQTFTARCPQVRDADWVCRVINQRFPHFSSTKHQPRITRYLKAHNDILKCDKELKKMSDIFYFIDEFKFAEGQDKVQDMLLGFKRMIGEFGSKRLEAGEAVGNGAYSDNLFESLYLMTKYKIGNCTENAILAELILKMNGIRNACCAVLDKGMKSFGKKRFRGELDHIVCVFNKDLSPIKGKITSKTVIIDPWIGKADFVKNMEKFYKNEANEFFGLKADDSIEYFMVETVGVSSDILKKMSDTFPEFIYNGRHKFLQK